MCDDCFKVYRDLQMQRLELVTSHVDGEVPEPTLVPRTSWRRLTAGVTTWLGGVRLRAKKIHREGELRLGGYMTYDNFSPWRFGDVTLLSWGTQNDPNGGRGAFLTEKIAFFMRSRIF